MSQSPVNMLEHRDTQLDRPKSVVRVIRGVAWTVHVRRLFVGSSSGMYGMCYLRVFNYVSVSQCTTGPARQSEVYPSQPQVEENPAHISLPYDHCLMTQHP